MRAEDIVKEKHTMKQLELTDESRSKILSAFPPKYPEVIAHHITYKGPVSEIPTPEDEFYVVGYTDNGESLETVVVAINGSTARPDGGTYHITLSLDRDKGVRPMNSNDLLANKGYQKVTPFEIRVR
jgi:hypothetical protein